MSGPPPGVTGGGAPPGVGAGGGDPVEAAIAAMWKVGNGTMILPYMVAGFFDFMALGIILAMVGQWMAHRKEEKRYTTFCVLLSLISAIASSSYLMIWLCKTFVRGFGTYKEFAMFHWASQYSIIFDWSTTAIQLFYTERAYRLNKNAIWIPIAVIPIMIITWITHVWSVAYGATIHTYTGPAVFHDITQQAGLYLWLSTAIYFDILITFSIAYALFKNKTGWKSTDSMLNKLIFMSLETQTPALIASVLLLGTWGLRPVGIIFLVAQPKIYIIGFLAILNFRFAKKGDTQMQSYALSAKGPASSQSGSQSQDEASLAEQGTRSSRVKVDIVTHRVTSPATPKFSRGTVSANRGPWSEIPTPTVPSYDDDKSDHNIGDVGEGFTAGSSDTELTNWEKRSPR